MKRRARHWKLSQLTRGVYYQVVSTKGSSAAPPPVAAKLQGEHSVSARVAGGELSLRLVSQFVPDAGSK